MKMTEKNRKEKKGEKKKKIRKRKGRRGRRGRRGRKIIIKIIRKVVGRKKMKKGRKILKY